MSRAKGWCFTINNPVLQDDWELISCQASAEYLVYGRETGEAETLHYQGYVIFSSPRSLAQMKKVLTRAHLEARKGTHKQASDYCKKDGDFEEYGELPKSAAETSKEMWKNVITWAEEGAMARIKDEYPAIYLRYLEKLRSMGRPPLAILPELENEWWYGATGTGKSRKLWRDFPGHYAKQLNKWWDGYENEEVVAIEEWAPKNECTASALKVWADRYPFPVEVKGGKLNKIRPRKIIVLSNYTPEQCFPQAEDVEPIRRRFKVIHFPSIRFFPRSSNDEFEFV
uniref:Replication-associated protein n=1 Tax=Grus japonensis CRESS-DNA-virus sp. TaxID=2815045 RepID=A0A8A4XC16_9VIRU|nr:MAG: replication-associated protein [Grus japonensis CRESS-DNA-virus sp.]